MKKKKLRKLLAEVQMREFDLEIELHNQGLVADVQIEDLRETVRLLRIGSANKDEALFKSNRELAEARRTIESHKGVKFDATDIATVAEAVDIAAKFIQER